MIFEIVFDRVHVSSVEEALILAHFYFHRILRAHPVDHTFYRHTRSIMTTSAFRNVRAAKFRHISIRVFDHLFTLDDESTLQSHHAARRESEIFLGRILHEVVLLDKQFATERHLSFTCILSFGVVLAWHHLRFSFGVIGDHHFQWSEHHHAP